MMKTLDMQKSCFEGNAEYARLITKKTYKINYRDK
jgi:hypothetical protein